MYAKSLFISESSMSQHSEANLSESDVDSPTSFPTPVKLNRNNSIDYSKFKTKMCRNFLMGVPCPFEDRCAFAHGPLPRGQLEAADEADAPPSYAEAVVVTAAPPSYASFLTVDSPDVSRPPSPPQYPAKFRYDPYSCQGVIFEN